MNTKTTTTTMENLQKELFVAYLQNGDMLSVEQIAEFSANPVYNKAFAQFVYDRLFATIEGEASSDVEIATVENTIDSEVIPTLESSEDDVPSATPEADTSVTDIEPVQIPDWCFMKLDDPNNPLFNNPRFSKEALSSFKIIKERAEQEGIKYVGQLVEGGLAKISNGSVYDYLEMLKRRIQSLYGIKVGVKIPGFAEAIAEEVAQFEAQKEAQRTASKRKEARQRKANLMSMPLADLPVFCSDADMYKSMGKRQRRSMKSCMTRLYNYLTSEGFATLNDVKDLGEEIFKGMVPKKNLEHFEKMQNALGIKVF